MKTNLTLLVAAAAACVACASQRPVVVSDDWARAVEEGRRSRDGIVLVELWANW